MQDEEKIDKEDGDVCRHVKMVIQALQVNKSVRKYRRARDSEIFVVERITKSLESTTVATPI